MTMLWGSLDERLEWLLGVATQATDLDRLRAWNIAQEYFAASHTAKKCSETFAVAGSSAEIVLPDDYIDLYAVYSNDNQEFLKPVEYWPGTSWDTSASESYRPRGFIEWPHGTVLLTETPPADEHGVTIWYYGFYPTISGSTSTIEVPAWSYEAILDYAAAVALLPSLSDTSFLNEFKTKVDAGVPVHNPIKLAIEYYMARYEYLLKDRPKQVRRLTAGGP